MKAKVIIRLKNGVLDPQGKAIENSLNDLGLQGASEVRQGKIIELTIDAQNDAEAREKLTVMCDRLLANPVMENYEIEIAS